MDEEKKTLGRAKIYTGKPADGNTGEAPAGDRRSRRAETIGTKPKEHLTTEPGRRRKDMETDAKMRRLWALLGVLVVILVIAIVYEIVLGHATVETGSQRMNQAVQETEQVGETEQIDETEQVGETELVNESEQAGETENEQEILADSNSTEGDGSTADLNSDAQEGAAVSDSSTLAGLND